MWPYIYMTKSLRDVLKLFKDQVISVRWEQLQLQQQKNK